MKRRIWPSLAIGFATALLAAPAGAQTGDHGHGASPQQTSPRTPMDRAAQAGSTGGMMGGGAMMRCPMMQGRAGMPMGGGMMGMMRPGTAGEPAGMERGAGMMGMMGQGMMQGRDGMSMDGAPHAGMRVTPVQHLKEEDVRHFFEHWLARHDNDRLKLGAVKQVDDETITAEIVTVDDSLVQRFRIDRHSGQVSADRG